MRAQLRVHSARLDTTLTRRRFCVTSCRRASLNPLTPDFARLYTAVPGRATRPAVELMSTRSATFRGGPGGPHDHRTRHGRGSGLPARCGYRTGGRASPGGCPGRSDGTRRNQRHDRHHRCGADYGFQLQRHVLASRHGGAKAHHVDTGRHSAGCSHHDLMTGFGDFPVRYRELFGPVAGRIPCAVLENPVGCPTDHEEWFLHRTPPPHSLRICRENRTPFHPGLALRRPHASGPAAGTSRIPGSDTSEGNPLRGAAVPGGVRRSHDRPAGPFRCRVVSSPDSGEQPGLR